MPSGRLRSRLIDLALLAGSTVLSLLLLEAGLHLATGKRYLDVEHRLREASLVYKPDQVRRWKRIEWDIEMRINSKGFRDEEFPVPAPEPSVLFLGDSFVEGYGVDLDKSMVKTLERKLGRRVYNAGIQGRGPYSYFQIYEDLFRAHKDVKLVLIGFFMGNDVESGPRSPYFNIPDPTDKVYLTKRFLSEHSTLYNFVRRGVKGSRQINGFLVRLGLMSPVWVLDPLAFEPASRDKWDFTIKLLREFRDKLAKDGRSLAIVLIPQKEMVEDSQYEHVLKVSGLDGKGLDRFALAAYLSKALGASGVPVLDLTPALRAADKERPQAFYFRTDGHFSPEGQGFAGDEVYRFVKDKRLLK